MMVALAPAAVLQPALEQARVEAQVVMDRDRVAVTIDYRLDPAGASEVPIRGIEFDPAQVDGIRAFAGDRELEVRLDPPRPPRIDGVIVLPQAIVGRAPVNVRVQFEVTGGIRRDGADWRVRLPLIVVMWPPREPSAETFVASVSLPGAAEIYRAFPASYRRLDLPGEGEFSLYRFTLPVVPSFLGMTLSMNGRPLLTLERMADLSAVGLLLGLALFGWRRFYHVLK